MAKSKTTFEGRKPTASRLTAALNTGKLQKGSAEYQTFVGLIQDNAAVQAIVDGVLQSLINIIGEDGEIQPNSFIGRGDFGAGPLQLLFPGRGLQFNGNVLELTRPGDWDFEITKSALQDVLNTTTLEDDTELLFEVSARDCWLFQLLLLYGGNNASVDFKLNFGLPSVNGWYRYIGDNDAANAILVSTGIRLSGANALTADIVLGTDADLTPRVFMFEMMMRAGTTGDVQFKFANNAAAATRVSRCYEGSVLRGRRLSVIPFGVSGPSDPGSGGTGPGGGSDAPTVPLPNQLGTLQTYTAANPGQIENSCIASGGNYDWMNGAVAALQAIDARFGFNYKRGIGSGQGFSDDAITYYHGSGSVPPADGDPNVYVIDVIGGHCGPSPVPTWNNVTTPLAAGGYHLGPL